MYIKNTLILLTLLSLIFLLTGCSALGSSAKIENIDALQKVKSIALPRFTVNWEYGDKHDASVEKAPYLFLYSQLDSILTMIPLDSSTVNLVTAKPEEAIDIGRQLHSDAVIHAKMRYYWPTFDIVNAELTITIIETATGKIIATSSHDTQWGNSYIAMPDIKTLTIDAILGCVETLKKSLDKIKYARLTRRSS